MNDERTELKSSNYLDNDSNTGWSWKVDGDKALIRYAHDFDNTDLSLGFYVNEQEMKDAENMLSDKLKSAIIKAHDNIEKFHRAELASGEIVETQTGVVCSRKIVPIDKVGLYIPGGTAPLFSTVLMLATPAKNGAIAPTILFAAKVSGVDRILKVGGAQAIAAFAYGTESVEKRNKIFGPGNRYVSNAKMKIQSICSIDMIAGPSEVMVVVDKSANSLYAATDLLSQAEHGKDSQVVLIIYALSTDEAKEIYERIEKELEKEIEKLTRKEYMLPSLSHSIAFSFTKVDDVLMAINEYAPEHLIINTENDEEILNGVVNAGSVFLGQYSPESAGDYASGTNHTLPTSGWSRSSSGVSTDSFIKKITVQRLSKKGIEDLAPIVIELAEAEGLVAHAEAARVRVENE